MDMWEFGVRGSWASQAYYAQEVFFHILKYSQYKCYDISMFLLKRVTKMLKTVVFYSIFVLIKWSAKSLLQQT